MSLGRPWRTRPADRPRRRRRRLARRSCNSLAPPRGPSCLPVGLQAKEDGIAENLAQRRENRFPCPQRELHDCVKVALLKLSDLDYVSHRRQDATEAVTREQAPTPECVARGR